MKKTLIIVFSIVIVAVIALITVNILKNNSDNSNNGENQEDIVFKKFGEGLKNLDIEFSEATIDIENYNVVAAKMYISNNAQVGLYYIGVDNENYEQIKKDGFISNKDNPDLIVSGIIENGYLFYLEQNFPKGDEVYKLFQDLTK